MWKDIPGWAGIYQADEGGEIRSVDRTVSARHGPTQYKGRILTRGGGKYPTVSLSRGRQRRVCEYVHRLVARTFIGPCPDGLEVRHKNGVIADCRVENLEYVTRQVNASDRILHGTSRHKVKVRSIHVIMVPWCQCCACRVEVDHICMCEQ
jgi:hypothetical protein